MEKKDNTQYLYRYMKDSVYAIDLLLNHELYFSHPNEFNDPYDCKCNFTDFTDISEEELIEDLKKRQEKNGHYFGKDDYKKIIEKYKDGKLFKHIVDSVLNRCRIVCFSESCDNPLMWAHYADGHKGICIAFNYSKDSNFFSVIKKVNYIEKMHNQIDILIDIICGKNDRVMDFLTNKFKDWSYEHEYRLIKARKLDEEDNPFYKFDKKELSEIYFGNRVSEETIIQYKEICETNDYKHVEFFQMKLSQDGSYKIVPQKCDIQPNKE